MPDFIIIGAQRCGTTSLYNYLLRHPCVMPALKKEVHFFDLNFRRGLNWYRSFFPLKLNKSLTRRHEHEKVVGEATPYYIFHPHAPRRAYETVPGVKLIVLLRNPVDRAYSHYNHEVRIGAETLSFDEALKREEDVLPSETYKLIENEEYRSFHHQHHSYLSRGIYLPQLQAWEQFFPREQMLILNSESFYTSPSLVMAQVFSFLDLPHWKGNRYKRYNHIPYTRIDPATRSRLLAYFKPHNQALYDYLGVDFGWNE